MLSAFTTPKQDAKAKCSVTETQEWKVFREQVPYCDGDKGICEGYGTVYINNDTYQVAFKPCCSDCNCNKYDLAEYTKKDGYNMRFWYNSAYHYVNIYIPSAAWEY